MTQWMINGWMAGMVAVFAAGAAAPGHAAQLEAAELKEGSVACRNERALSELIEADAAGDSNTRKWLFDGYACIELTESTAVKILKRGDRGLQHLRTVNRRRNIDLWIQLPAEKT